MINNNNNTNNTNNTNNAHITNTIITYIIAALDRHR